MSEEGKIEVKNGVSTVDKDGDLTTTLVKNKECSFVIFENGIAKCSIEKAYNDGFHRIQKTYFCHLFPIRIMNIEILN